MHALGRNTEIRQLFAIGMVVIYAAVLFTVTGCSYQPVAIRTSDSAYPAIFPVPVREKPVIQTKDFNLYEAEQTPGRYFIVPAEIKYIEASRGSVLGIALERTDGGHLIVVLALGPGTEVLATARRQLLENSIPFSSLEYYPVDQLSIRPLTDARLPQDISYTAITAPGLTPSPFHVLVLMQVKRYDDIAAMKSLLNSHAGVLFEVKYALRISREGTYVDVPLSTKGTIGRIEITSLSM